MKNFEDTHIFKVQYFGSEEYFDPRYTKLHEGEETEGEVYKIVIGRHTREDENNEETKED